jgi:hypothetical protein
MAFIANWRTFFVKLYVSQVSDYPVIKHKPEFYKLAACSTLLYILAGKKLSISLHTLTYAMKWTIFCGGKRKQQIHSPLRPSGFGGDRERTNMTVLNQTQSQIYI